jgi:hypothetical protein
MHSVHIWRACTMDPSTPTTSSRGQISQQLVHSFRHRCAWNQIAPALHSTRTYVHLALKISDRSYIWGHSLPARTGRSGRLVNLCTLFCMYVCHVLLWRCSPSPHVHAIHLTARAWRSTHVRTYRGHRRRQWARRRPACCPRPACLPAPFAQKNAHN